MTAIKNKKHYTHLAERLSGEIQTINRTACSRTALYPLQISNNKSTLSTDFARTLEIIISLAQVNRVELSNIELNAASTILLNAYETNKPITKQGLHDALVEREQEFNEDLTNIIATLKLFL